MLHFLSPSRLLPPLRPLRRPRLIRTLLFEPLFLLPLQPVGWLALRDLAHLLPRLLLAPAPLRRRALDPELRRSLPRRLLFFLAAVLGLVFRSEAALMRGL